MTNKAKNTKPIRKESKDDLPGYPAYESKEDMYRQAKKEAGPDSYRDESGKNF